MFTTPLRSEKMPAIAPKIERRRKAERLRDERRVERLIEVVGARVGGEDPEPDPEQPAANGAPAEPAPAARNRPDPQQHGDDADQMAT
jgi:hypothetical protein